VDEKMNDTLNECFLRSISKMPGIGCGAIGGLGGRRWITDVATFG